VLRRQSRELVLITGVHGFLGQHVVRLFLDESRADLILSSRQEQPLFAGLENEPRIASYIQLDITDRNAVRYAIGSVKPDVIVNCAGFVDVDRAEKERELAWRSNVSAVEYLIESARKTDARIVHVSTDFIFDGQKTPYAETAAPNPLNYYGRTKLASENALRTSGIQYAIVRAALLYGIEELKSKNMAIKVYQTLRKKKSYKAFTDIATSPTLVDDIALALVRMTEQKKHGIYHFAGPEMLSRFDFAKRIAKNFHLEESLIEAVSSEEMEGLAARPKKSAFVTLKAQTELSLRPTGIDEGLQVTYRGLQDLSSQTRQIVYT
jgi:dTDP-4-dehydrorhamnose reductase